MSAGRAFISYASADRARVRPFVEALAAAGLSVWWDQEIERGRWGDQIERELNAADHVLVFLSRAATRSGYVFVEARRAEAAGKLVPLVLDDQPLPLQFDGLCALLQKLFFRGDLDTGGAEFARLLRACGVAKGDDGPAPARSESERAHEWFAADRPLDHVALCLAVAVLEHAPYPLIDAAARRLHDLLQPPQADAPPKPAAVVLQSRQRRLAAIEAEPFDLAHDRYASVTIGCARFIRPERATAVLDYAWRELDGLREPLLHWLYGLAADISREVKLRVGLAVGKLAQADFGGVYPRLIRPWALDDDADRRETADIALSVAGYRADLKPPIERILHDWAAPHAAQAEARALAEFAAGYTGARLPELGLPLLRDLSEANGREAWSDDVLRHIQHCIAGLVQRALRDEDSSLWDLDRLLTGLADWIAVPKPNESPQVPIFLFLSALSYLPLASDASPHLSLAGVLSRTEAKNACVRALGVALQRHDSRDMVRDLVNNWIDAQSKRSAKDNPLPGLADALAAKAPTARDRDRVAHLFRHACAVGSVCSGISIMSQNTTPDGTYNPISGPTDRKPAPRPGCTVVVATRNGFSLADGSAPPVKPSGSALADAVAGSLNLFTAKQYYVVETRKRRIVDSFSVPSSEGALQFLVTLNCDVKIDDPVNAVAEGVDDVRQRLSNSLRRHIAGAARELSARHLAAAQRRLQDMLDILSRTPRGLDAVVTLVGAHVEVQLDASAQKLAREIQESGLKTEAIVASGRVHDAGRREELAAVREPDMLLAQWLLTHDDRYKAIADQMLEHDRFNADQRMRWAEVFIKNGLIEAHDLHRKYPDLAERLFHLSLPEPALVRPPAGGPALPLSAGSETPTTAATEPIPAASATSTPPPSPPSTPGAPRVTVRLPTKRGS